MRCWNPIDNNRWARIAFLVITKLGTTLGELAQLVAGTQSSAAVKDTNPNAKFEILQQSWDKSEGIMTRNNPPEYALA